MGSTNLGVIKPIKTMKLFYSSKFHGQRLSLQLVYLSNKYFHDHIYVILSLSKGGGIFYMAR